MCPISDRNLKTEFAAIDPADVLRRVVALPLSTWRYRKDEPGVRHLGPMAQDFHAAFGLWNSDTMIFPLDASGVSMAAIQGLHARLVAAEAENEDLRARLEPPSPLIATACPDNGRLPRADDPPPTAGDRRRRPPRPGWRSASARRWPRSRAASLNTLMYACASNERPQRLFTPVTADCHSTAPVRSARVALTMIVDSYTLPSIVQKRVIFSSSTWVELCGSAATGTPKAGST
ncbi:MAG: tail fiber domain-containing protein [Nannocystis sp.]|nr:tail fiber domain-containing protein [Nannocystis sp.]